MGIAKKQLPQLFYSLFLALLLAFLAPLSSAMAEPSPETLAELQKAVGSATSTPHVSELRVFLLETKPSPELAKAALYLLLNDRDGLKVFLYESPRLLEPYSPIIEELITEGEGNEEVLRALWNLKDTEGIVLEGSLRALVVAKLPDLGLKDLLENLDHEDSESSGKQLAEYEKLLVDLENNWSLEIAKAQKILELCSTIGELKLVPRQCWASRLKNFPDGLSDYLLKVQTHQVLKQLQKIELSPEEMVERLALTDFKSTRPATAFPLLMSALQAGANTRVEETRARMLDETFLDLFSAYARDVPEIAESFARLLVRAADDASLRNERPLAAKYYELSLEVYPEGLEERDSLFSKWGASLSAAMRDALEQAEPRIEDNWWSKHFAWLEKYKREVPPWAWIIVVEIIVLIILGMIFLRIRRWFRERRALKKAQATTSDPFFDSPEFAELRELVEYFGVSSATTMEELETQYERKVEAQGSNEEQCEIIKEKYERTKHLLLKQKMRMASINPQQSAT